MMDEIDMAYFTMRANEEALKAQEAESCNAPPRLIRFHKERAQQYQARALSLRASDSR